MFHGADENSQCSDDEDGTSTNEPNEQIESQPFSPGLTNVHTLHPTNIHQTWRWNPPSKFQQRATHRRRAELSFNTSVVSPS